MTGNQDIERRRSELSPARRALLEKRLRGGENGGPSRPEPIPRREHANQAPLSFAQQRLWFLDRLMPGNPFYTESSSMRLRTWLNVPAFERSLDEIVRRHEILRTTFRLADGEPVQVIAPPAPVPLRLVDLRSIPADEREAEAYRLALAEAREPFDLGKGPLIRTSLLQLDEHDYLFLLTMHHIVSDGWSLQVFARELGTLYEAFAAGRPSPLAELPVQYADFAVWQRQWLRGERLERQLGYWKEQLANVPPLKLPTTFPRPAAFSYRGEYQEMRFSEALSGGLKALSRQEGVTLFMTMLAAFKVLLHRYTFQDDLVVGTPVANRSRAELEALIGFFVNTLVIRTRVSGDLTFRQLLHRVREVTVAAQAHQDLPFEKLVEELQPERDLGRNPLFQVVFQLGHAPSGAGESAAAGGPTFDVQPGTAKFDLRVALWESPDGLRARYEYSTDLFDAPTIARMMGHYRTVLEGIVADPDRRVAGLPLLTAEERAQLGLWNDTTTAYPRDATICALFDAQAHERPEAPALLCGEAALTYRELQRRANRLAHYLRALGVGPESSVGICASRSVEMVVGLLGILKAGGAYVPLDPGYPAARLAYMIADARVRVVLTEGGLLDAVRGQVAHVVDVKARWAEIEGEPEESPPVELRADNLAYAMYTSGSTGQPKGVSVVHRGVVRLVKATNYADFGPDDVFLQFAPLGFDASTLEIWGPLLNGGRLVLFPNAQASLAELDEAVRRHGVTTLWLTSGLFNQIVEHRVELLEPAQRVMTGGDIASIPHFKKVLEAVPSCRLSHYYGPTENTTFSTWHPVTDAARLVTSVPIGRPIANSQAYVLDPYLNPLPVGIPGELYVGGDGLARSYLNSPRLTAERFVPNPFGKEPGTRLYRTGDLVRQQPDGALDFLGRIDQQVKIRGFRVEPGEVETRLAEHEGVRQAVVVVRGEKSHDKRLVAYVVPRSGLDLTPGDLRYFLQQRLPDYMIPSAFVQVEALPLNPNGKVDRNNLPRFETHSQPAGPAVVAESALERLIGGIWQEVLEVSRVGLHDNFFELGGHSLLLVQVHSRLQEALGIEIPMTDLFQYPTVSALAAHLGRPAERESGPAVVDRVQERVARQKQMLERQRQRRRTGGP